jgi:hypothetical protein
MPDIAGKDQQAGYSSLRQAVDRIMGFAPGGSSQTGQPQQESEFQMAAKRTPGINDVSSIVNTPTPEETPAPATPATAAAPATVTSAPATGTDPNAGLYSWTTPRERAAAAAASAQGIDYWGTTSPESRAAAFKSQDAYDTYKFKGQEWNDPIAQRVYQQFNPNDRNYTQNLANVSAFYGPGASYAGKYSGEYSPLSWNAPTASQQYKNMMAEYNKQGGLAYGPISPYGH